MKLKDYLKTYEISQREFAQKMGIKEVKLSKILNGYINISLAEALLVEDLTGGGVKPQDFLDRG